MVHTKSARSNANQAPLVQPACIVGGIHRSGTQRRGAAHSSAQSASPWSPAAQSHRGCMRRRSQTAAAGDPRCCCSASCSNRRPTAPAADCRGPAGCPGATFLQSGRQTWAPSAQPSASDQALALQRRAPVGVARRRQAAGVPRCRPSLPHSSCAPGPTRERRGDASRQQEGECCSLRQHSARDIAHVAWPCRPWHRWPSSWLENALTHRSLPKRRSRPPPRRRQPNKRGRALHRLNFCPCRPWLCGT